MRVLLDECVPARLRSILPGHAVQTVSECGWRSHKDQTLLAVAGRSFDVLVTVDQRLVRDNDLSRFRLAVVVIRVRTNRLDSFLPLSAAIQDAIVRVRPGRWLLVS